MFKQNHKEESKEKMSIAKNGLKYKSIMGDIPNKLKEITYKPSRKAICKVCGNKYIYKFKCKMCENLAYQIERTKR